MTRGHGRTTPSEDSSLSADDGQMKDHLDTEGQVEMKTLLNGHSVEVKVDDRSQRKDGNEHEDSNSRHTWARKLEYILSVVGFCVGMGNVLRFPYLCIRNGGGAFLIPYFLCLTLCGIPLFYLEVGLGQFMSRGAVLVWNVCPLFKGIGVSMNIFSFTSGWYYSITLAYIFVYLAHSFRSPLPWSQCGQEWNTDHCVPTGIMAMDYGSIDTRANDSQSNTSHHWPTSVNNSIPASKEFWIRHVLQLSSGLDDMDGLVWYTTVALFVSIILTFVCIIKSVESIGKVVYVTATLPYILLTVLLVKGVTLPGSVDGILFYVYPDFNKLLLVSTWIEASIQVFYSLGPAYGTLITMASYNKFNNNCLRDSIILCFVCEGTSVFAGFAMFSILGHMAYNLNTTVSSFAQSGPGLAFVVYPEAITYLPLPQLWGVLFFLMLGTVCLDSQFTLAETVLTSLQDAWPKFVTRWQIVIKCCYGVVCFLLALPFATRGGMYLFQLIEWYFAAFAILLNGILECVVVGWIYGAEQFMDDLHFMCGKKPSYLFVILWRFVVPVLLLAVLITTLSTYQPPVYEGYVYGPGAVIFGWFIASVSFLPIPIYAAYRLSVTRGTLIQRLKVSCTPTAKWRPQDETLNKSYQKLAAQRKMCTFRLPRFRRKH